MSGTGQYQFPNQHDPLAISAGREISSRGRVFNNGAAHSFELKVAVGITYQEMVAHEGGGLPNYTAIADIHRVDPGFVKKVESELFVHGRVLSPEEIRANADRPIGPGSQTVCDHELFIIMMLYYQNPSRSIRSYRDHIFLLTGNQVSLDTIHRVILGGFPYKGSRVKPNLIPLDKFKEGNVVRAYEYLTTLFTLTPEKVCFVDEKSGKAGEIYTKYVRKDPLTGIVPSQFTPSDFRNTISITAFCSINRSKAHPIWYRIHDKSNDMEMFRDTCFAALQDGFFHEFDVVVADSATIHNDVEDMFWMCGHVLFIFLPTRTPEWNPKELNWALLLMRLANFPLDALKAMHEDDSRVCVIIRAFQQVLDGFTFEDVEKNYAHCYDFFPHWRQLRNKAQMLRG